MAENAMILQALENIQSKLDGLIAGEREDNGEENMEDMGEGQANSMPEMEENMTEEAPESMEPNMGEAKPKVDIKELLSKLGRPNKESKPSVAIALDIGRPKFKR